ncbi:uncharacterized protein LOC107305421 isoform X2 [Oryza brachyantha]|uniref:uncharacterized protein LOC107305421 isoform X2 n=1 Tax=Oryza brachyantha TaxID=4533 RepID=UPI001ADCD632|nr:uncharacterized protein LOC107305421 isoform X2 [Oryza brachyantha]
MDQARRRHVVPAFGEWNYYYQCDHDQAAATAAEVMRSAPVVAVAAAAADEWYASYSYGGAVATAEACSDVWFKYSPPPRRPTPKKSRRPEGRVAPEKGAPYGDGDGDGRKTRVGQQQQHAARSARAYQSGGSATARTPAKAGAACRVVKRPVDADLYQVPPSEFVSRRPRRKRAVSSLWMGCLGLNCVA